jgi:transcriptional regulator with XRE-family HTH domain
MTTKSVTEATGSISDVTLEQFMADQMRDPEFAAAWEETQVEGAVALALTTRREALGLSQRDLAAATGMKQPMIARIEKGSQTPTVTTLWKLLRALDADIVIRGNGSVAVLPVFLSRYGAASVNDIRSLMHRITSADEAAELYQDYVRVLTKNKADVPWGSPQQTPTGFARAHVTAALAGLSPGLVVLWQQALANPDSGECCLG